MSNIYTKKSYDNQEDDSENTHDELWLTFILHIIF